MNYVIFFHPTQPSWSKYLSLKVGKNCLAIDVAVKANIFKCYFYSINALQCQHWSPTATCAAALELPNLNYMYMENWFIVVNVYIHHILIIANYQLHVTYFLVYIFGTISAFRHSTHLTTEYSHEPNRQYKHVVDHDTALGFKMYSTQSKIHNTRLAPIIPA